MQISRSRQVKVTDEAVRSIFQGRKWNPDKCLPLQALFWLIGALAIAPVWFYIAKLAFN